MDSGETSSFQDKSLRQKPMVLDNWLSDKSSKKALGAREVIFNMHASYCLRENMPTG